jgi:hypothetical protein
MEWGLLQGLGQGLSQAAGTINRGMAEDRAAERARELEQKRAASVERRWQASEARANRQEQAQATRWAKQDERQASQDARQRERDAVSDNQFDQRSIERNLSGVMEQANKAAEDIENRYAKLAVDSLGQPLPKAQLDALLKEKKNEMKAVRTQYATLVNNYVKSYGDKLRGTGFAYLLDVPDIEEVTEKKAPPPGETSIDDLFNRAVGGQAKATPITGMVKDLETGEMVEAAGTKSAREATFLNAFSDSLGGEYNNDAKPITNDRSPIEMATTFTGGLLGYAPGKFYDSLQFINDKAIQPTYKFLDEKPSQRK